MDPRDSMAAKVSRSRRRVHRALGLCLLGAWLGWETAACGPQPQAICAQKAMAARSTLRPDYADSLTTLEKYRQDQACKNEYVQYGMYETSVAMLGGDYDLAGRVTKEAHAAVRKYQDANSETAAALGNEAVKFFKGEPHERALLCYYAGLVCYLNREYNDARIFFTQSLQATATRDDDMEAFRDDFCLGHYWLGRTYLKLQDEGNARVAFQKAGVRLKYNGEDKDAQKARTAREKAYPPELKAEAVCFQQGSTGKSPVEGIVDLSKGVKRADMPDALAESSDAKPVLERAETLENFLQKEFQEKVNLVLMVEMGVGPLKHLAGYHKEQDDYTRLPYNESGADVYIDGQKGGATFQLVDTYHQAYTRGVKTRRGRQVTKAVVKEILSNAPFVGSLAGHWDVSGDARYWCSLPGEIHVYAARVTPGVHDIALKFFDANDNYLPRYDLNRHYIPVPAEGETVLLLYSMENQENAYLLEQPPPKK